MSITIRKVRICDAKQLIPLMSQLGYPISEEDFIARIAQYQIGQNDIAWVALYNESIVGCAAVHIYDFFHCTERCAKIVSIVVDEKHRQTGIGRMLILRAEKYAKEKNCSALELSCSLKRAKYGAHDFYDKLGYKNEGEFESRYLRKFLKPKEGPIL